MWEQSYYLFCSSAFKSTFKVHQRMDGQTDDYIYLLLQLQRIDTVTGVLFWRPLHERSVFGTSILVVGMWFGSNNTAITTFTMKNPKMQTQTNRRQIQSEDMLTSLEVFFYANKSKEQNPSYHDYRLPFFKTTRRGFGNHLLLEERRHKLEDLYAKTTLWFCFSVLNKHLYCTF